jgi:hypothetical protein
MNAHSKGNNPETWQKLLDSLDDKMQFGLLNALRNCVTYHFEGETLFLESNKATTAYLTNQNNLNMLKVYAGSTAGIKNIQIKEVE